MQNYTDHTDMLYYLDQEGSRHAVESISEWMYRKQHILAAMQLVMGELPDKGIATPLDMRIESEQRHDGYCQKKISYCTGIDASRVPAYLLVPTNAIAMPAVLCLHQTTAVGKDEPAGIAGKDDLHYAMELAERGYVCIVPDYPGFGEYDYDFGTSSYESGVMQAVWNNIRALDLLETLPEIDSARIGCIGHSLGGHTAMFTAAFDERIKAVVSSCGFCSFETYKNGDLSAWAQDTYMPKIAAEYNSNPKRVPFDFSEIVASFAPRAFLGIAPLHDDNFDVQGVQDVISQALPVYALFDAEQDLLVIHPDCAHEFPSEARDYAYSFLARYLVY